MIGFIWRTQLLACLLFIGLAASASEPPSATLAAFDIGSGTTRMLVADVALCTGEILHVHDSARARVSYADDLAQSGDGQFSAELIRQANQVMAELSERADAYRPERKLAVTTEAFRLADNAETLMAEWRRQYGLDLHTLAQDEEARLAWRLVSARLGQPARLLVWDIGAGSQQLVWRDRADGNWRYLNSDLASVTFRNRAIELLGRPAGLVSPNPLSGAEADQLSGVVRGWIDPDQARAVAEAVADGARVVGIGGVHGVSLLNQLGLMPGDMLERSAIATQLERQLDRDDETIGGLYADTEVVNLVLVGALMDLYGIDRYQAMPINLTEAVLLDHVAGCGQ